MPLVDDELHEMVMAVLLTLDVLPRDEAIAVALSLLDSLPEDE